LVNYRVLITEPINEIGVEYLRKRHVNVFELKPGANENDLSNYIDEVDGLVTRGSIKVTRDMMKKSRRLKVIGVHGIECDHVDLEAAKDLHKKVCNTPDALTVTVSEMALSLILASLRNVVSADKAVRAGSWNRKYSDLIGGELSGRTVGIIGMGRIGEATASKIMSFGASVIYWSRNRKREVEHKLGIKWVSLEELLKNSDIISLHVAATSETYHMIGEKQFSLMKDGVRIVNTARGRIIDEQALIKSLESGKVKTAALDVFENEPLSTENPLCKMDNVILTPHIGASNREGMERMALQVAQGVYDVLRGREPANPVV